MATHSSTLAWKIPWSANGWSKCHKMNHVGFKALYISCLGTKSFTGIGHTEHSGSSRYPFK